MDDTFNITIIGAGVVGLAVAEELSSKYSDVLVVEKNRSYGLETSSRHSGVIHAGIYYPLDFLKAVFCRQGNRILYEVCKKRNIPHKRLGKLIVAANDDEAHELEQIKKRSEQNNIMDMRFLSQNQIRAFEPDVSAKAALFSPSTGIIDSHSLMESFYINSESNNATVVFNSKITNIYFDNNNYELEINNDFRFKTRILINCAGLFADKICSLAGIDINKEGYCLKYCKGNYFSVSPGPGIRHLVYPVPQKGNEGLGIHATLDLDGRVRFGPDTQYVTDLDYSVDNKRKESFFKSIRTYLPKINKDDLHPDMCGIRPKLQGPGEPYKDFVIKEERKLGYPGLINLIGIESPGLTSCIPIARYVSSLVRL
ncbi:MAG: NAD(P)/FAD-dependent oxidoreductase [Desulfobacterales bacterium]|nr:NAD(P)/FAD-dependent oxidoreductase [Desulfobacterales bacterium]